MAVIVFTICVFVFMFLAIEVMKFIDGKKRDKENCYYQPVRRVKHKDGDYLLGRDGKHYDVDTKEIII